MAGRYDARLKKLENKLKAPKARIIFWNYGDPKPEYDKDENIECELIFNNTRYSKKAAGKKTRQKTHDNVKNVGGLCPTAGLKPGSPQDIGAEIEETIYELEAEGYDRQEIAELLTETSQDDHDTDSGLLNPKPIKSDLGKLFR